MYARVLISLMACRDPEEPPPATLGPAGDDDDATLEGVPALRADVVLPGETGVGLGRAVASAGDLDGDGRGDLLVGEDDNRACLWTGPLDGEPICWPGTDEHGALGEALAGGADLDGDGLDDLVLADPMDMGDGQNQGAVWMISGATLQMPGAPLFRGSADDDVLGTAVLLAPDLSGDGMPDLVVGVPGDDKTVEDGGAALIFFGPLTGAPVNAADVVIRQPALRHLGSNGDALGGFLAGEGDLDGDGISELVVSAGGLDEGALNGGAALIFSGPLSEGSLLASDAAVRIIGTADNGYAGEPIVSEGDLTGDGAHDLAMSVNAETPETLYLFTGPLSPGSLTVDDAPVRLVTELQTDAVGWSVAAGEVTGDDQLDLIVGAPNGGDDYEGMAYVMAGPLAPGVHSFAEADRIKGEGSGDKTGLSVAVLHDTDGDGVGEVVIGQPGSSWSSGQVAVFFGWPPPEASGTAR